MSFALVAYYLRTKGADNSALLQQLDLNLSFLNSELSQHTWHDFTPCQAVTKPFIKHQ